MTYLIPAYSVCYAGKWYSAGEKVRINDGDVTELSAHGIIEVEKSESKAKTEEKTQPKSANKKK